MDSRERAINGSLLQPVRRFGCVEALDEKLKIPLVCGKDFGDQYLPCLKTKLHYGIHKIIKSVCFLNFSFIK